jgi:glycosyltransferase involved in cell wall biosynthesis
MTLIKPLCIIQAPIATRSGYGDMSRDIARHIIESEKYEVKLVSTPWGVTPQDALIESNPKDKILLDRIIKPPFQLTRQPDIHIQISVPNEFTPQGKYNIGITAGIETNGISLPWIEGCNRMNTVWTISEHSKNVIVNTIVQQTDEATKTVIKEHRVTVPVEVLHNCIDTNIFKRIDSSEISPILKDKLFDIKERFCFLFVGHWLKGNYGEDRKNVGVLVRTFCETFKQTSQMNQPALILKTSGAGFSLLDREDVLNKIRSIRNAVGSHCPNVYLLHGELTDAEMNELYNHPKVKVHVSFTKGEGFGRPLLEATQSQKPIIASGWSGQLDFLALKKGLAILLPGELKQIEPGAVWENVLIKESSWFNVNIQAAAQALMFAFKNYDQTLKPAVELAHLCADAFGYDVIKRRTIELLEKYVPAVAIQIPVTLPTLKKIGGKTQ